MKKIQIGSQEAQVGEVDELCCALADEVEALIQSRAEAGKFAVLGLATGSTPLPLYAELIRRHREEGGINLAGIEAKPFKVKSS